MASYWIVVPRGNAELFDLLSTAFRGRTGFSVIEDRRRADGDPAEGGRRSSSLPLGPDEIVVAERTERAVTMSGERPSRSRPVLRRRSGAGKSGPRRVGRAEPVRV
jgi:hypothetical protein